MSVSDPFEFAYCGRPPAAVIERAAGVRLAVLDVDGILTDGRLYIGAEGETVKPFHVHDGKGIALLRAAGIDVAIITARRSAAVAERARELRVVALHQGAQEKGPALDRITREQGLPREAIAYMGDDLVDLPAFRRAGLTVTVPDAHPLVRHEAHWETRRPGGHGAVRELCELILAAQGRLAPCFTADG